jgi:hypothetical protein
VQLVLAHPEALFVKQRMIDYGAKQEMTTPHLHNSIVLTLMMSPVLTPAAAAGCRHTEPGQLTGQGGGPGLHNRTHQWRQQRRHPGHDSTRQYRSPHGTGHTDLHGPS